MGKKRTIKKNKIVEPEHIINKQKVKERSASLEVKNIFEFLGRGHSQGNVQGDHLGTILTYLITTQREKYNTTLAKLSLKCATGRRYIKENYLDGLEAFGIIQVSFSSKDKSWIWRGLT